MKKIRVGITGGAGYTGGELIRILLNHPDAELVFVQSKSNAGNPYLPYIRTLLVIQTSFLLTTFHRILMSCFSVSVMVKRRKFLLNNRNEPGNPVH